MSSIVENNERVGRFTSSEISKLMKSGKSGKFSALGLTYIEKKYLERNLNRSLDLGAYSQSMAWGLFMEQYVYSHFTGLDYEIMSDVTHVNPNIKYHAGSADLLVPTKKVSDIKCYQPLKFTKMAECFMKEDLNLFKKQFDQEYWQLVSNAVIHDVPLAESILYMPTLEELQEIREMAMNYEGVDQWKYRFIYESEDYQLPFVPEGSKYSSLNKFEFEVPEEDIDHMLVRLALAEIELNKLAA